MICEVSYIQIEVYHWIKAFFSPKEFLEDMIQTLTDVYLSQGFFPPKLFAPNYLFPSVQTQNEVPLSLWHIHSQQDRKKNQKLIFCWVI